MYVFAYILWMCICMFACALWVHVYAYIHMCEYIPVHVCTYVHAFVCVHIYACICVCWHTYVHLWEYACICLCTNVPSCECLHKRALHKDICLRTVRYLCLLRHRNGPPIALLFSDAWVIAVSMVFHVIRGSRGTSHCFWDWGHSPNILNCN